MFSSTSFLSWSSLVLCFDLFIPSSISLKGELPAAHHEEMMHLASQGFPSGAQVDVAANEPIIYDHWQRRITLLTSSVYSQLPVSSKASTLPTPSWIYWALQSISVLWFVPNWNTKHRYVDEMTTYGKHLFVDIKMTS